MLAKARSCYTHANPTQNFHQCRIIQGLDKKRISPAGLHKHAKLHSSSSHSFASQEASLVQEVAYMAQDLEV